LNISGGTLKGRKVKSLKGQEIRPTSEKMRQAFFSVVQNYIEDAIFIDLCSGTGIMAFEALSRGALNAVIVENANKAIKVISDNSSMLQLNDSSDIINENVVSFLKRRQIPKDKRIIIYFDPPYLDSKLYKVVLSYLAKVNYLKSSIIAVEHLSKFSLPVPKDFSIWKVKQYGDKTITLFASF